MMQVDGKRRPPELPAQGRKGRGERDSKLASHIAINMAVAISLSAPEIEALSQTAYTNRNYRFTDSEIETLDDIEYRLNKELKAGREGKKGNKITKNDIVRISLKLFEKIATTDNESLFHLLKHIT